jgi:DNA-binding LytR/AlgR family response regulator
MIVLEDRILLHLQDGRRIPVDPQEIYLLQAEGGETLVRTRHAQPLTDVRQLSELIDTFEPFGFAQIHRSWAVNLRRVVREIRPAPEGGWEVKLDPPVNRVLPVSRRRVSALWKRFGE